MLQLTIFILAIIGVIANGGLYFDVPVIQKITDPIEQGEEPTWEPRKQMLFYVDINTSRILSFNYATMATNSIQLAGDVTPVIPDKYDSDLLIIGNNRSVVAVQWDGTNEIGNQTVLTTISEKHPNSYVNDGKADKQGRFWLGTLGTQDPDDPLMVIPDQGVLYKITSENLDDPTVEIAPVNISNGLTWNKENTKFYYIDTNSFQVAEYDFDVDNGTISNRRVAFDFNTYPNLTGSPDGMTVDVDGNIWVALFNGGCIVKIDPVQGEVLQKIGLPSKGITSLIWGGPNYDILFVTTAKLTLSDEERLIFPDAGSVFAISNLNTTGFPTYYVDLENSV